MIPGLPEHMLETADHQFGKVYRALPPPWRRHIESVYARMLSVGVCARFKAAQSTAERTATRLLSVVVPVHNGLSLFRLCATSLKKYGGEAEVIIVDDGATDAQTPPYLACLVRECGWRLLERAAKRGHSAACAAGVAASTRPIVCLLNADTICTAHSWAGCVDVLMSDAAVGVVGPSTSLAGTRQCVVRACRCRHYWTVPQIEAFADAYVERFRTEPVVRIPDWLDGFVMFIRRAVWEEVGGFSGCRPHYGNDVDLCAKLLARGYGLAWTRVGYVHHFGGGSVNS